MALGVNASVQHTDPIVFVNREPILIKTDSLGNIVWTKTYRVEGGKLELSRVIQTSDGGYALGGVMVEDVYLNIFLNYKISLMKLDSQGNVQWSKLIANYSGSDEECSVAGLIQTSNQGYAVTTGYRLNLGKATYITETRFLKTDSEGNLELNKTISGGSWPISIVSASDGGFAIISYDYRGRGNERYGIVKIDSEGNTQWTNTYFRQNAESYEAQCGIATSDNSYILGGYADISNFQGLLFKIDSNGNMSWNKVYAYGEYASSIQSISQDDEGVMFVGTAGNRFTWVGKIDGSGNLQGELRIDMEVEIDSYFTNSIMQTEDGGFVFVGTWNEAFQAAGEQSLWLVKIANFYPIPSSIWLSMQLTVLATTIVAEAIIAMAIRKRFQKAPATK